MRVEVAEKASSEASLAAMELKQRMKALNEDNIQLYEKLQFVKGFNQQHHSNASSSAASASTAHSHHHNTSGAGGGGGAGGGHLVDVRGGGSVGGVSAGERRYASLYAETLNPFTAFKAKALQMSERNLPPSERVTLSVARLVFSRKAARSFAFFYALVLHLLIFIVLYTHTLSDHCAHPAGAAGR